MTPRAIESRAQQRAQGAIIAPPEAPVVTDNRDAWRRRRAWHVITGQRYPLRVWRA